MTFYSKIDWWMGCILYGLPLSLIAAALALHLPALLIPGVLSGLVIVAVAIPTSYSFKPEYLELRSGFLRNRVTYSEIQSIQPTRNPLASCALSLDRLDLCYAPDGHALISPKDAPGFIRELFKHVPHLQVLPDA